MNVRNAVVIQGFESAKWLAQFWAHPVARFINGCHLHRHLIIGGMQENILYIIEYVRKVREKYPPWSLIPISR